DAVFQLHLGNSVLAASLARAALQDSPKSTVGILASRAPADSARAEAVAASCRSAGLAVVGREVVPEDAVDLTHALTSLRDKHATALFLLAPPRLAGIAAAQVSSSWPKARIYGFDALDPAAQSPEARGALE